MRRAHVERLRNYLTELAPANSPRVLLDVGTGSAPYMPLAQNMPVRWIAVDYKPTGAAKIVLDAQQLPFPGDTFDIALCLQVWEYLPDLDRAAAELYRVLKPGGCAIISNPAVYPPFGGARWRIMPDGYRTLLAQFSRLDIDAECNTVASFFRTMNVYLAILLEQIPVVSTVWRLTLCPLVNLVGRWANSHFRDAGFAANYIVRAYK